MKRIALVALALLAASTPCVVSAQVVVPAARAEKPKETCPCSDYRFVPVTEKAKAVVAYWDARRTVNAASLVGSFVLLGAILSGRPSQSLNEATDGLGRAQSEMYAARKKAEKLGGLTVAGAGESAVVTVTLEKGVDYTLDGR